MEELEKNGSSPKLHVQEDIGAISLRGKFITRINPSSFNPVFINEFLKNVNSEIFIEDSFFPDDEKWESMKFDMFDQNKVAEIIGFLTPENIPWTIQKVKDAFVHYLNFMDCLFEDNLDDTFSKKPFVLGYKNQNNPDSYDEYMIFMYLIYNFSKEFKIDDNLPENHFFRMIKSHYDGNIYIRGTIFRLSEMKEKNDLFKIFNFSLSGYDNYSEFIHDQTMKDNINVLQLSSLTYEMENHDVNIYQRLILDEIEMKILCIKNFSIDISYSENVYEEYMNVVRKENSSSPFSDLPRKDEKMNFLSSNNYFHFCLKKDKVDKDDEEYKYSWNNLSYNSDFHIYYSDDAKEMFTKMYKIDNFEDMKKINEERYLFQGFLPSYPLDTCPKTYLNSFNVFEIINSGDEIFSYGKDRKFLYFTFGEMYEIFMKNEGNIVCLDENYYLRSSEIEKKKVPNYDCKKLSLYSTKILKYYCSEKRREGSKIHKNLFNLLKSKTKREKNKSKDESWNNICRVLMNYILEDVQALNSSKSLNHSNETDILNEVKNINLNKIIDIQNLFPENTNELRILDPFERRVEELGLLESYFDLMNRKTSVVLLDDTISPDNMSTNNLKRMILFTCEAYIRIFS